MYIKYHFSILCVLLLTLLSSDLSADEGMWMPHQMKILNLEEKGLIISPDDLYKSDGTGLMSAIVDLGGGTGSFVSDQGLIITNHHVAFGALQRTSDPQHNYLQDGFLATTFSEEIQAPGYTAGVLLDYREVTDRIESGYRDNMSALDRYHEIDLAKKKLVQEAEEEGPDYYAEVAAAYAGNQYYLFVYKRIKDVRIVYAPPRDLGNFGGEVDNWMWPRHTCDFTFLRAYVSPDGFGEDYDEKNVPYQPKVHLKVAKEGVSEGDLTFIMGYPGKTYRNFSTPELLFDIDKLKRSIETRLELIDFFKKAGQKSKAVEIKYASMLKGLYNGLKNYRGKLEGFEKVSLVERKKELDQRFMDWYRENKTRSQNYNGIISEIKNFLQSEYKAFYRKNSELSLLTNYRYGASLVSQAHILVRMAIERQKPDMERDNYYQERNLPRMKQRIKLAERRYNLEVDKDYTILLLERLSSLPETIRPAFINKISDQDVTMRDWIRNAFKETKITTADYRLSLIGKSVEELKDLEDPLIDFAFLLEAELSQLRILKHSMDQKRQDLKKIYEQGLLEMYGNKLASDANSTIRFTYGPVKGYKPADAVTYKPLTTLKGVVEKDTGKPPFRVPDKIKQLYRAKDFGNYIAPELDNVPICFLNTTNVTGGNSGSPTINARGEITGLVFDMTYESVIGDYYIIPEFQRTINVDIRYVLFVTDKFSGAKELVKELGL